LCFTPPDEGRTVLLFSSGGFFALKSGTAYLNKDGFFAALRMTKSSYNDKSTVRMTQEQSF
jgi:hypothetical protein